MEEEALVAEVHPVDGSWSRSIGVLLYLLFILATGNVFAESQDIREIRQYYQRISSETTRCLLNSEPGKSTQDCNLYLLEVSDNKLNVPVCSVGIFKRLNQYWLDTSGFLDVANEHPGQCDASFKRQLVNVEINGKSAALRWYEQFVYRHGELVFYFIESDLGEYRFYFKAGDLIRYRATKGLQDTVHPSLMPTKNDGPNILRTAGYHQNLFLMTRQEGEAQPQFEVNGSTSEGEDSQLCYLNERGAVPDDVKFDEQDLSVKRALEKLDFVQQDVVNQMGKDRTKAERNKCQYPDCIAGVAWETLNIGAPNALSIAKGVILKLEALYLRERMKNEGADVDKIAFESARKVYCNFIATQAYVD